MPTVVGVKLRYSPKVVMFDASGTEPAEGDLVVVSTERGTELGTIVQSAHDVAEADLLAPLKPVTRIADEADLARADEFETLEREAMPGIRRMIAGHGLDMKPVDVEYLFGGDKVVVYFVAEERVDFRDLVKELASRFHLRIDMRQVGVRDEARMVGGIGHCGQQLCCSRFAGDFQPVSIRMAKEQDLPLNPLKISGVCGRLMCCLRYEFEAYKDYKSRAPKRGAIIETPMGLAKVADLGTPRETVDMRLEDGKRFTVALADMHCCKGEACPCAVTQEVLEAAMGTGGAVAQPVIEQREAEARLRAGTSETPMPTSATASAEPTEPKTEGGRKRRRRGTVQIGGSGGPAPTSQEPAKPAEKEHAGRQRETESQKAQPRARRAPQVPAKAAQKAAGKRVVTESKQPNEGPAATVRPARRRRRRRSPGTGDAGSNGGATPSE